MILISCDNESSDNENLKDYRATVETTALKDIEYFFFVGKSGWETGLYKYNLNNNKYKLFWSASKENVVQLLYSDNLEYAFFITARRIGTKRGVSFIRRIKLYSLDLENSSVELVREIGDAVQLLANWLDNNFMIQLTQFDMKITSHINKIDQIYSPFGKLLKEETEIYDFIKDSYPQFAIKHTSLISPSGNFGITQSADSIFLSVAGVESKVFIDSTGSKVKKVKWNSDESYVFFTADPVNESKFKKISSTIYVYNVVNQKTIKKWDSDYKMNFFIANKLLIFDTSVYNQSSIVIYDFNKDEDVSRIQIRGGCGIINIPLNAY